MRDLFARLVHSAWAKFRYDFENNRRADAASWYHQIGQTYWPITNEGELRSLLPGEKNSTTDLYHKKAVLVLRMVESGGFVLPFFTMNYDFQTHNEGKVWMQLVLLCRDGDADSDEVPFGTVGYRVEPPEEPGASRRSDHDYYHVQPIRSLRRGAPLLERCPPWLPDQCPTWPLYVKNPVEAFLSVLVGLYGIMAIHELLREGGMDKEARNAVTAYGKQIAPMSFPDPPAEARPRGRR